MTGKLEEPKPKLFKGVCIHCGSDALRMNGTRGEKQIYFCNACGRIMGGSPIPAQNLCGRKSTVQSLHCPKCRGAARIRERVDEYRSRLVCNVCGYYFTDCYRHAPPDRDSGPFLYPITFHLDPGAVRGLMEICRVTRLR